MGDQIHAQHSCGFGAHLGDGFDNLHATTLTTPARMDLGFDHPDRAGLAFGYFDGSINSKGRAAFARGHAKLAQHFLGLIFVNVHVAASNYLCLHRRT